MRKLFTAWACAVGLVAFVGAARAQSPQRRDYFLDAPKSGVWLHGDVLTLGAQATLESRTPIEDETFGTFSLRASGLAAVGYAETAGHVDLRYLLFTFGASAGYRNVWRTYEDTKGGPVTRDLRLEADADSAFTARAWAWREARARLVIPLETFWFVTNHALRSEDGPPNTYDWFHTNVHDGGSLYRGDAILFVRSASLGAIGPYVRVMDLPRGGDRKLEAAAGFVYGVRPGLAPRDDLLTVFVLARPGDDEFGFHTLRMPLWAMAVYRASFRLFE